MVVDHIHDHAQAALVQSLHSLLELADAHLAMERVGCIRALRHAVVHRIIAPVERRRTARLVHRAKVLHRHQLHMRETLALEVGHAGRMPALPVERGVCQRQRLVLAAVRLGHAAVRVGGKVPHVNLADHVLASPGGRAVARPARRVGARQVHDHGAHAVHAAGPRVRVGDEPRHAVHHHVVAIVHAVKVLARLPGPQAALPAHELVRGIGPALVAAMMQVQRHALGRRGPERKARALRRHKGPQRRIAMKLILKVFGIKDRFQRSCAHVLHQAFSPGFSSDSIPRFLPARKICTFFFKRRRFP